MAESDDGLDSEFSPPTPSSPDLSKALILHPIHSNFARAHPEYNHHLAWRIPDYQPMVTMICRLWSSQPSFYWREFYLNGVMRLGGYVMDIGYFSYFLSLYLPDKETQRNTYLNPCSELSWIPRYYLLSNDPIRNNRSYLTRTFARTLPFWLCLIQ